MNRHYFGDPLKDTITITREEFRREYKDFIDNNKLIDGLKEQGMSAERILIEQLTLVLQLSEFESLLFGEGEK